jgi:hypothetical protein
VKGRLTVPELDPELPFEELVPHVVVLELPALVLVGGPPALVLVGGPPVLEPAGAPPTPELVGGPPVVEVAGLPLALELAGTPPMPMLVLELAGAPPVFELTELELVALELAEVELGAPELGVLMPPPGPEPPPGPDAEVVAIGRAALPSMHAPKDTEPINAPAATPIKVPLLSIATWLDDVMVPLGAMRSERVLHEDFGRRDGERSVRVARGQRDNGCVRG